jgi:hypothetical protein
MERKNMNQLNRFGTWFRAQGNGMKAGVIVGIVLILLVCYNTALAFGNVANLHSATTASHPQATATTSRGSHSDTQAEGDYYS